MLRPMARRIRPPRNLMAKSLRNPLFRKRIEKKLKGKSSYRRGQKHPNRET